jgi:hypothetical protein
MEDATMRESTSIRSGWKRRVVSGALILGLMLLPAAAARADDHPRHGRHPGHGRGHHAQHAVHRSGGYFYAQPRPVYYPYHRPVYAPIRVRYYRPYLQPVFHTLPSPYVVIHGPGIAAQVVGYPAAAPVVYEPGYCPAVVHYHPYYVPDGVHGSVSLRIGF